MKIFNRIKLKPLLQLLITFIIFACIYFGLSILQNYTKISELFPGNFNNVINQLTITFSLIIAVILSVKFIEKNKLSETGIKRENFYKYLLSGFIMGGIL